MEETIIQETETIVEEGARVVKKFDFKKAGVIGLSLGVTAGVGTGLYFAGKWTVNKCKEIKAAKQGSLTQEEVQH